MTPSPDSREARALSLLDVHLGRVRHIESANDDPSINDRCRGAVVSAMIDFADQELATAEQQRIVPGEGMVLVPREPTEAMIEAGRSAQDVWDNDLTIHWSDAPQMIYRAMLAALSPDTAQTKGDA